MKAMPFNYFVLCSALMLLSAGDVVGQAAIDVKAQVWADNWFALYVDAELVMEDSEPIDTERSFNAETFIFSADLPAQVSLLIKDYKENDSGLEYIGAQLQLQSFPQLLSQAGGKSQGRGNGGGGNKTGSSRSKQQQMGDGGLIAQFYDNESDKLLAVSSSAWRCLVIHQAPLNTDCEHSSDPISECQSLIKEAPSNWTSASFDDSGWPTAVEYSAQAVSPRGGYDSYQWEPAASLIWGGDLEIDNTLLCRFTLTDAGV